MNKIKQLRQKHNLTQKELATMVGVSNITVYNWERGKTSPGIYNMSVISKVFGIRLQDLVGEGDD